MNAASETANDLPEIPVIDLGAAGPVELVRREPERAKALLTGAYRQVTAVGLAVADFQARRWLVRSANPYRNEIETIAAALGRSGTAALNLSYEWACTAGVAADADGGSRLLRTLDWPFHGLGRNLVVTLNHGPAGRWVSATWPGFVGVLTAMAPARFAAAINQPPLRYHAGILPIDWLVDRLRVWRSNALPPVHLLRQAFERCRSYGEARDLLAGSRLCLPALFTLSGVGRGEGCVIERTEDRAVVHEAPAAVANHWLSDGLGAGRPRGDFSAERRHRMAHCLAAGGRDFGWLVPPIANRFTRLALSANAATGDLAVQGWERDGPATRIRRLSGLTG